MSMSEKFFKINKNIIFILKCSMRKGKINRTTDKQTRQAEAYVKLKWRFYMHLIKIALIITKNNYNKKFNSVQRS